MTKIEAIEILLRTEGNCGLIKCKNCPIAVKKNKKWGCHSIKKSKLDLLIAAKKKLKFLKEERIKHLKVSPEYKMTRRLLDEVEVTDVD